MLILVSCLIAVIFALGSRYCRRKYSQWRLAKANSSNSPVQRNMGDPVLGISAILQDIKAVKTCQTVRASSKLHAKYGNTFIQTTLLQPTLIRTVDEENVKTIFATKAEDWAVEPTRLVGMGRLAGQGILTNDGPVWKRARALFQPLFQIRNISDLESTEYSVERLIQQIPSDGSSVDLQPLLSAMFMEVSSHFALGQSPVVDTETSSQGPSFDSTLYQALRRSLGACQLRLILGSLRIFLPDAWSDDQSKTVHSYVDSFVEEALDNRKQDTKSGTSLLDSIVEKVSDKTEVRSHIIQGLGAGHDTVSCLVGNTIFLVSRYPDVWRRIRLEAMTVISKSGTMRLKDTKRLTYLRKVLQETLRLHPVFPRMLRTAATDTILPSGGDIDGKSSVVVAAGTHILIDYCIMNRNTEVFGEDARDFNPDRWDTVKPTQWQYMPFGAGLRTCLGQQKALAEACCTISKLALRFDRVESRDDLEFLRGGGITGTNAHGCNVAFFSD